MTILITGAGRGVGRALVNEAVAQGRSVIGTLRQPGVLPGAETALLDVTSPASARALASWAAGRKLDLLVCNAGVLCDTGETLDTGYGPEIWAESFAVNVTGVFLSVQALLPNLRAARGKIAIISSQMGSSTRAPGGTYAYRASKAAAVNLGRNLASDLKSSGIAVGIYHPGWVQTDMGGPSATLPPAEAAKGLLARFDALSLATTGCFETWDGKPHPL